MKRLELQPDKLSKLNELDSVRFVCNILVVILHSWAAFQYVPNSGFEFWAWTLIDSHIAPILLPTLFLVSGYLLFKDYSMTSYLRKIKSRIKRLVVPYFIWNATFVMIYLVAAGFVPRLQMRVNQFNLNSLQGCLEKIVSLTVHPIDGPLWFVRTLFVFAVVSPIVYFCYQIFSKRVLILLGALLFLLSILFCDIRLLIKSSYPIYSILLFGLGGYLAWRGISLITCFRSMRWWWLVVAVFGIVYSFVSAKYPFCFYVWAKELSVLVQAPLLLAFAKEINEITNFRLVKLLMPASFFIYAGHFLFASILLHLIGPRLMMGGGVK